jgi:hypothetical protein
MTSREMERGSVGTSGVAKVEKRPLREHKESRNGGSSGGPGGTRSGGLTNPNSGPGIAGPDSVSANGLRKVAEGKVSAPQFERSTVLRRIASKDGKPGRAEEGNSQCCRGK